MRGPADRRRLDEYFEAVRDVERQMAQARDWARRPKPNPGAAAPGDIGTPGQQAAKLKLMFDVIHLALKTDSTRVITIKTFGDHHDLSHHGKEPGKLGECRKVESELMAAFATLVGRLKATPDGDASLLDRTTVFLGSNLRDGNTHWTDNLPALLAAGGFRHGQHLAFNPAFLADLDAKAHGSATDRGSAGPVAVPPLCNLYVSILQRLGVPTDRFGSATGTLAGLTPA